MAKIITEHDSWIDAIIQLEYYLVATIPAFIYRRVKYVTMKIFELLRLLRIIK